MTGSAITITTRLRLDDHIASDQPASSPWLAVPNTLAGGAQWLLPAARGGRPGEVNNRRVGGTSFFYCRL